MKRLRVCQSHIRKRFHDCDCQNHMVKNRTNVTIYVLAKTLTKVAFHLKNDAPQISKRGSSY